jgi:hypothetical protein
MVGHERKPMNDPNQPDSGSSLPSDGDMSLKSKGSKTPLYVVIAVVVLAGGYFGYSAKKKHDDRKIHAAFMESLLEVEKKELAAKFWACILGPNVDPAAIPDNLALGSRIEQAFGMDLQGYPTKVREDCTPKAKDAKNKLTALAAPPEYDAAIKAYAKTIDDLIAAFDSWATLAPEQVKERELGKKVQSAGNAYHAFEGGKPTEEVIAYDRFFHCAVPDLDKMKDEMAMAKFLFESCKKAEYVAKLQNECGQEVVSPQPGAAPTKGFQATLKKFSAQDREQQAFDDCLRKARKGRRKDDLEAVGRAWVANLEAGKAIKKIGAEALKD